VHLIREETSYEKSEWRHVTVLTQSRKSRRLFDTKGSTNDKMIKRQLFVFALTDQNPSIHVGPRKETQKMSSKKPFSRKCRECIKKINFVRKEMEEESPYKNN
jgi:hypothetical protein